MNRILESYLEEFRHQFNYESVSESDAFEYFCAFCLASTNIKEQTITKDSLDEIVIGGGDDWGIDGVLIKVNGIPVNSMTQLDYILIPSAVINVDIILFQAKTSTSIDHGELKKFLAGSRNVAKYLAQRNFDNLPQHNESLDDKLKILDSIYKKAPQFPPDGEYSKPNLTLYYMHAGTVKESDISKSDFADNARAIDSLNLMNVREQSILNDNDLVKSYTNSKQHLSRTLEIEHHLPIPKVANITESHLCLIPFREFRKLICSNDGNDSLLRQVFEDNVRDFQGNTPVNAAIEKTLKDGELRLFTALNNGLTVIARDMRFVGKELTLNDYQIVNGCQTCHVLYNNRNIKGIDDLMLSVKVISSSDKEIRDKIIVANNSQTEVQKGQLTSLLDAQRNIEAYYLAQKKFMKLYYERRSKQYRYGEEKIPADKVVTIPSQILAFVSMILGEPHLTSNYYGQIIDQLSGGKNNKLFDVNTAPAFYYTSALAAFERSRCINKGIIGKEYTHVKHHLLLAFRLVAVPENMPALNSNSAQDYCDKMCEILSDVDKCDKAFKDAAKLIEQTLGRKPRHNDLNDIRLADNILATFHRHKNDIFKSGSNVVNKSDGSIGVKIVGKIDLDKFSKKEKRKRT